MPKRYAENTEVPVERTQSEIRAFLKSWGATGIGIMEDSAAHLALIVFQQQGRVYRLQVPLPPPNDPALKQRASNQYRYAGQTNPNALAQVERQRWRAALLWLKAQKEAVDLGFLTFEQAFVAHAVLANQQTVAQWVEPQLDAAQAAGSLPRSLPGLPDPGAPWPQLGPGREE